MYNVFFLKPYKSLQFSMGSRSKISIIKSVKCMSMEFSPCFRFNYIEKSVSIMALSRNH